MHGKDNSVGTGMDMKPKVLEFHLQIVPVSKLRPRMSRTGAVYTPAKTTNYEKSVAKAAAKAVLRNNWPAVPEEGMYEVYLYIKRANNFADIDNLAKSVLDGLNGVVYNDDRQIRLLSVGMITDQRNPGIWVGIVKREKTEKVEFETWRQNSGWFEYRAGDGDG